MKKSLVALAVLGALTGVAHAQVTLYGLVDTGVVIADDGDDRRTGIDSSIAGASRWGIRGSEDLGGGLKAHFVLESGFSSDSGEGDSVFSRLSYLGLNGGFGTVRLGRQDTAMKDLLGKIDPFGAAGIANAHDYLLSAGIGLDEDGDLVRAGLDQRRDNQITYLTPNFGGFNGGVYYNFGETYGDSTDGQIIGLRVGFDSGPLSIQLAHENINVDVNPDLERDDTVLGATWDFNVAKLHAAYARRSNDGIGNDARSGMLGVSAPLGRGKVMANYIRVENRDSGVDEADSNVIALGYNYNLSKRTALIARYVRTDNDTGADLAIADGDYSVARPGENANVIGLGVQHKF